MAIANRFMGQGNSQKLSKAYDFANTVISTAANPQEALQKAGVTTADIDKARKVLNSPVAGMIAKMFGTTREDILRGLDSFAQTCPAVPVNLPAEQAPAGELERMQANLARLK